MVQLHLLCLLLIVLVLAINPMAAVGLELMASQSDSPAENVEKTGEQPTDQLKRSKRDMSEIKLGRGFYLPDVDILGEADGGLSLFETIPIPQCVERTADSRRTFELKKYYRDTNAFYNTVGVNSGISANLRGRYTMGTTLNFKSSSKSSGYNDVSGLSLDIYTHTAKSALKRECYFSGGIAHLSAILIRDFMALPKQINNPSQANSWIRYKYFLKKYGSHFLTQIKYGARLQQWTFASIEKRYTETQFAVKACASFEGVTQIGTLNVNSCSGYSSTDAMQSSNYEMSHRLDIKGGSDDTRNRLRAHRTPELITKLLNEGRTYETPVDYAFEGIWELLKEKFPYGNSYHAVAVNLQQYYEGFLEFGCSPLTSPEGLPLRWFGLNANSNAATPTYQCVIERTGCHGESDCHVVAYQLGFGLVGCFGNSCVTHIAPHTGTKAMSAQINRQHSYISRGCYYQFAHGARCNLSWSNNVKIWSGENLL